MIRNLFGLILTLIVLTTAFVSHAESPFRKDNIFAWCIVPFDAAKRGPEERAQMLEDLGLKKMAYDWRTEHIPTFDAELDALEKHHIELTAFWIPIDLEPENDPNARLILDLLKRRHVNTQIWITLDDPKLEPISDAERVKACAKAISFIAKDAESFGSQVALYNHGGWFGEPENQIEIIKEAGMKNVGLVYCFHHGHEHLSRFPSLLQTMRPYLLSLCMNGMREEGPMIIPLGQGDLELGMLRQIKEIGYTGPIGILDHRNELDTKISLQENLDGLKQLVEQLDDQEALKTY